MFEQVLEESPKYLKIYASKSLDLIDQIDEIMSSLKMSSSDLAKELGKNPSEISKWLSGGHNMTLKTISKLEAVFNQDIILTKNKVKPRLDIDRIKLNFNQKRGKLVAMGNTDHELRPVSNGR